MVTVMLWYGVVESVVYNKDYYVNNLWRLGR